MVDMKITPAFEKALEDLRCAESLMLDAKRRLAEEGHKMWMQTNPMQIQDNQPTETKLVVTQPKDYQARPKMRRWTEQESAILKGIVEKHSPKEEKEAYAEAARVLGRSVRSASSQVMWLKTKQNWDKIVAISADSVAHVNGN